MFQVQLHEQNGPACLLIALENHGTLALAGYKYDHLLGKNKLGIHVVIGRLNTNPNACLGLAPHVSLDRQILVGGEAMARLQAPKPASS